MPGHYIAKPLTPRQIAQALPLARILDASLTEEQWTEYATPLASETGRPGERGIMTVQSRRGTIYGLSAYWLKRDLRQGRILEIENFAALDLKGGRGAAKALLAALEDLAERHRCNCIAINLLNPYMRLWLREPRHPGVDLFRASGYRGELMRLRKCFVPEAEGPGTATGPTP